ncbi:MAG: diguanylate cyclase [Acidobacteria bacterium]|nr:diguanylate cyclase [Acidobacteriota bacterium]
MKLTCLITICTSLWALDPNRLISQYGIRHYDLEDGILQSSVQAITQTPDGYMWFGTQDGLTRFNSRSFHNYSMVSLNIVGLEAVGDQQLWIAADGRGLVSFDHGQFTNIDETFGLVCRRIRRIFLDSDQVLWVIGETGVHFGDLEGFETLAVGNTDSDPVIDVGQDKQGRIFLATSYHLYLVTDEGVSLFADEQVTSRGVIASIRSDAAGRIFVAQAQGMARIEGAQVLGETMRSTGRFIPIDLIQDRDGLYWLASSDVLNRYHNSRVDAFVPTNQAPVTGIRCLFEDREGNLWVGTESDGVVQIRNTPVVTYGKAEGLDNEIIFPILEDREGRVWMGGEGGSLAIVNESGITLMPLLEPSNQATALAESPQGDIYVGCLSGLYQVVGDTLEAVNVDLLAEQSIWALLFDRKGDLWVGTVGIGLLKRDDHGWTQFGPERGLPSPIVSAILEDRLSQIWAATDGGGLCRIDGQSVVVYGPEQGLDHLAITSLLEDHRGVLWITTHGGGMYRFDGQRFHNYSMSEGLPANLVYAVLEDNNGDLWCSSTRGIFRIARQYVEPGFDGLVRCERFGLGDGMRSVECNGGVQACAIRSSNGNLWFATIAGAIRINPARLFRSATPPLIIIESLTVSGELLAPKTHGMSVGPGVNQFQIDFSGLCFTSPENVRYSYRLDGFEEEWVLAEQRATAYYTNIPPGDYVFHVRADNGSGVWSEQDAKLPLRLIPYFKQTNTFKILMGVLIALLLGSIYAWRVRDTRLREIELKALVAERTQDLWKVTRKLQDANTRLEKMSFTDPLTGVGNRRRFEEVMEREWRRALRNRNPISIVMMDIDFFKSFNDTYGHQRGDDCLCQVASALSEHLNRATDVIARYGGEEFVVCLPETDIQGAFRVADVMRLHVTQLGVAHSGSEISDCVTISAGVSSTVPDEAMKWQDLVERADQALYQAKRLGRNRVERLEYT